MAKRKATRRRGATKRVRKSASAKARRGAKRASRRARAGSRRAVRKASARKTTKKVARKATRKARPARKASVQKKAAARKAAPRVVAKAPARPPAKAVSPIPAKRTFRPRRAPTLDRERRTVEPEMVPSPPSSLNLDRSASAARSGRKVLAAKLKQHTSTGPALTAGDLDADWESAESVGDEAPGGDNPTPDQDVVDEIGKALGVEYEDDEELQGGDEIIERDRNRWELDPASKDDFEDDE